MAIEFPCGNCRQMLRVPDGTAGRQAQCPHCSALGTIPADSRSAFDAPLPTNPAVSGPGPSLNPYQSPATLGPTPPTAYVPMGRAPIGRATIEFGDIVVRTWRLYRACWGACIGGFVVVHGFGLLANVGGFFFRQHYLNTQPDEAIALTMLIMYSLCVGLIAMWLAIGGMLFMLDLARGRPARFSTLFSGLPYFIPFVLATIVNAVCMLGGMVACFVPGIIVFLMWSQYPYLIIDRNAGIIESLSQSYKVTEGNRLTLLALFMVLGIINTLVVAPAMIAGMAITWGNQPMTELVTNVVPTIASVVVSPYIMLMSAVIYLVMTGQPTGDRPIEAPSPDSPFPPEGDALHVME